MPLLIIELQKQMPNPVPSCASVIPLDYGNHLEYSIMLVDEWGELHKLLAHPVKYLKRRQTGWAQAPRPPLPLPRLPGAFAPPAPTGPIPWLLKTIVMAEIRPLTDRPDLAPIVLDVLGNPSFGAYTVRGRESAWETFVFNNWEKNFPGGFFIAEFAANTALLQIAYLPPWKFQGRTYFRSVKDPAAFGGRTNYFMDFTPATIGYLGGQNVSLGAVIHQDLKAPNNHPMPIPNQADRANLIVDLLGSREWYVGWLNANPSYSTTYALESLQVPPSLPSTITIQRPQNVPVGGINPPIGIAYPIGSPQPGPDQSDLPRISAQLGDVGRMDACYVTQLLDPRYIEPLVRLSGKKPFKGMVLGEAATKIYFPLPPPVG